MSRFDWCAVVSADIRSTALEDGERVDSPEQSIVTGWCRVFDIRRRVRCSNIQLCDKLIYRPSPILAHLDEQLTALRNELSTVYRTQAASQNKQLALSDALRDRDEEVRELREEVRTLREAKEQGLRRERDWEDRWKARTKDMEVSHSTHSFRCDLNLCEHKTDSRF